MTAISAVIFVVSGRWNLITVAILGFVENSDFSQAAALSSDPHRLCNGWVGTDSVCVDVGFQAAYHRIFSGYKYLSGSSEGRKRRSARGKNPKYRKGSFKKRVQVPIHRGFRYAEHEAKPQQLKVRGGVEEWKVGQSQILGTTIG